MFFQKSLSFFKQSYRSLDKGLLNSAFILILFGIFLTFAAGPGVAAREGLSSFYFVKKQLFFFLPALAVLFAMSLCSVKIIRRISLLILLGGLVCMICVLFVGTDIKGAKRWISLGFFSLQPSEFVKPAFAVVCAWLLASARLIKSFPGYQLAFVLYGVAILLLFSQPDFGMVLTVSGIFGVQLFLSGIPLKAVSLLGGFLLSLAGMAYLVLDHVQSRIDRFFGSGEEAYQVRKSLETLRNAGWFGKGPGEGVVKYELPDAHTDFILAVSAEEFGFILSFFLVALFAFIVLRGFFLISRQNNYFCLIAVSGLLTQLAIQAIVNMGSTLNLLPTKGMTLPFISYGGSSLISIGFAFGMILGLTKSHALSKGLE